VQGIIKAIGPVNSNAIYEAKKMVKHILHTAALLTILASTHSAMAQNAPDPACMMKNADGIEAVDKSKCSDGLKLNSSAGTSTTDTTASTTPASSTGMDIIVPAESLTGSKVMTASDFVGKRVYSKVGKDIGEVNDLIVTDNGGVQAAILGVGGFLRIGEKNVAVSMKSINMQQDGSSVKLMVDATADMLKAAPNYDSKLRTYTK
jgi:sporulation protein YlmC with PRC-barrel domain